MGLIVTLLSWGGVGVLLHSTYSCLHYRSLALAADIQDASSPPADVVIEAILGFVLCLVGQLKMCGPFHQVRITGKTPGREQEKRREIIAPAYRTRDFDRFTTRVRAMAIAKDS
mmetsp:Transcript_18886/g.42056  ORF Transcript_18886/g.42056 Transcript_18886/m.42056 type:complete len:114 (+) Transcript_18886:90-431(+)